MATIKTPRLFLGNYINFKFEKIIERHSARGEWKHIPYINDYKNIFVQMPNGDIIDFATNKKMDVYSFDEIDSLNISKEVEGVTNLISLSKYYADIATFLKNVDLILNLINVELEQSNSWLPKENLTLQPNGAFSYSGELTEAQKIIMTMNDNMDFAANEVQEDAENIEVDDDLYIGFLVEREMDAYYSDDLQLTDSTYLAKDVLINMLPQVKLLKKTERGYIDVKLNIPVKVITAADLILLKEAGYQYLNGSDTQFHIAETIGICNVIKLSDFLNNLGGIINPNENIENQINNYYEGLKKLYMYDKVSDIKYPKIESVLKRSLTIGKKVN